MTAPAIVVERLGKQYKIGLRQKTGRTFPEAVMDALAAPFRRLRTFGEKSNGDDTIWALRDVSFDVQPGEVVGIIGRNGAGKSTLLKVLSRITEPTAGRAVIRGRVRSLLEVGTGFHPELTGRENIYLNGALLGMKRVEINAKFDEIVAFSEIDKFLDTPVKRYSSGMYVRLAFAVAAHLEPEILIVDEVLAVGDAVFQKKCLGKMKDVAGSGRTILFVSHNMSAVLSLCGRALWLDQGGLKADAPAPETVQAYQVGFLSAESDTTDLRADAGRRKGTGKVRFSRLTINAGEGACGNAVVLGGGADLELGVELECFADVAGMNVAVVIHDSNRYRLIDVNTALKGRTLDLSRGQRARVTFKMRDVLLKPGSYCIELWAGRGEAEEYDDAQEAGTFTMIAPPETRHTEVFPGPYQCRFEPVVEIV